MMISGSQISMMYLKKILKTSIFVRVPLEVIEKKKEIKTPIFLFEVNNRRINL